MNLRPLLTVLGLFLVLSKAAPAGAQIFHVRISIKIVLDANGQRPSAGYVTQDSDIEEEIGYANEVLRTSGANWRLDLVETLDAPGISQWFGPLSIESGIKTEMEREAEADPNRYLWRLDAINLYVLELSDVGGFCSFPGPEDIILIGSLAYGDLVANQPYPRENILFTLGYLWLHEIGHYLNLRHTHAGPACQPCTATCQGNNNDGVEDTLPDSDCWMRDDIARYSFGRTYSELEPQEQRRVDLVWKNVMSYHSDAILRDREAFLTPGQLLRTELDLEPRWLGRRAAVVTTSCDVSGLPGEVEPDCNRNGTLDGCEPDCNRNGSPDDCDLAAGTALDCNANGVPDECDVVPRDFGFAEPVRLPGSLLPTTLAAADLDGDGHVDLASANAGSTDFTVFFGAGDGSFSAPAQYAAGHTSTGLAACDLDGEGSLDLILTDAGTAFSPEQTLSVLFNSGGRAFAEPIHFEVGLAPVDIACADLTGDGLVDVVVASSRSEHLSLLRNLGQRRLAPAVDLAIGGNARSVAAADLDLDGDLDLLASQSLADDIIVLTNEGGGAFSPPSTFAPGFHPGAIEVNDLNQDGRPDLLVGDGRLLKVWTLHGDGTGGFEAPIGHDFSAGPLPTGGIADVTARDMNGDGRCDLVLGAANFRSFSVLLDSGDGGFAAGERFLSEAAPSRLTAADFDEDGFLDLAAGSAESDFISVHRNSSTPPISPDCNRNGLPDGCDIASGRALDGDADGVPDECSPPRPMFHRADPNADGTTDISDGLSIFGYLFLGTGAPACLESADANSDGSVDISDGIGILNYLFLGAHEPAPPGPAPSPCGVDTDAPGSASDLGCVSYDAC